MRVLFFEAAKSRPFRAIGIVCVCLALPLVIDGVGNALPVSSRDQMIANGGADLDPLSVTSPFDLESPYTALKQIEALGNTGFAQIDARIVSEIPLPDEANAVRYDEQSGLFGFEVEGDSQSTLDYLSMLWEQQGWRGFPLGQMDGATFVKEGGAYQWMMVACTQLGTRVCVVVHPLRA